MSRDATKFGIGRGKITWNPDFQANLDNKGLWTGSITFTCNSEDVISLKPDLKAPCQEPGWSFMLLVGLDVRNNEGGTATVNCKYSGATKSDLEFGFDDGPEESTSQSISVSTEPIQSHPRYKDLTPSDWAIVNNFKNGAYKVGRMEGGLIMSLLPNVHDSNISAIEVTGERLQELLGFMNKGIESYLAPHQVYRIDYTSNTEPSTSRIEGVGYIENLPPAPDGKNWLYMGMTYTETSGVYSVSLEWELSGPGGWNETLYTKEAE